MKKEYSNNLEAELYELEQKYKLIAENTSDGIFVINADRIVTFLSSSFSKGLGYEEAGFLNKSVDELNLIIHPDDRRSFLSGIEASIRNKESKFISEVRVKKKDGSYIWHEEHISFTYDSNNGLSAACAVCRDITDRKEVEAELIETKRMLKLQLEYIMNPDSSVNEFALTDIIDLSLLQKMQDSFTEATGVSGVITDPDGNPVTTPGGLSDFCQLVEGSLKGREQCLASHALIAKKAASEQHSVTAACPDYGLRLAGAPIIVGGRVAGIWIIEQGKTSVKEAEQIAESASDLGIDPEELVAAYNSISSFSAEKFMSLVKLLDVFVNEISSCAYNNLLLARKIEEQAESEKRLIEAKIKAEESDKLKTAFLSNISHEIRTPLNGMLGFIDLLSKPDCNTEDKAKYNELVWQSSKRLVDTINNIIEISLIETGQFFVRKDGVSVKKLFDRLVSEYTVYMNETGVHLSVVPDSASDQDIIQTDEEKLFNILRKLLDNAFKYTREGRVTAGWTFSEAEVHFYVKDTGIGIDAQKIESIFNRFEQAELDYTRSYEGTGLGLSIVKAYVEILGGKISVKSRQEKPEEGISGWTEFDFSLFLDYN